MAGDPAAARDQYTELLPTIDEVSGSTHPYTLADRANLAHWTALATGPESTGVDFQSCGTSSAASMKCP
jgi:hypothetical protein